MANPDWQGQATAFDAWLDNILRPETPFGPFSTYLQFRNMSGLLASRKISLPGKRCIDFGCGGPKRMSMSSLLYLAGAERVLAVDRYDLPNRHDGIAWAVWAMLMGVLNGKSGLNFARIGHGDEAMRHRAAEFDLNGLRQGDLSGLPQGVQFRELDFHDLPEEERRFDLLVSFSVFEHVKDIAGALKALRQSIADDGVMFLSIDYRDHRQYTEGASNWQYLIDDGDVRPGHINKIRHSRMMEFVDAAGFRILEKRTHVEKPTAAEASRFLPKYAHLSEEDIATLQVQLLLASG